MNIESENALKALMKVRMEGYEGMTIEEMIVDCSINSMSCRMLEEAITGAYGIILKHGTEFGFKAYKEDEEIHAFGSCAIGIVSSYIFIENSIAYEATLKLCER
jgi:hypothetical protein